MNFADKIGWALGAIILFIVFLVVGRVRIGRSSGKPPKWQHPADRGDKPERPPQRARGLPVGWGRKAEGERKHEKDADHPKRGQRD